MSGFRTLMAACSLVLFAHVSLAANEAPDLPIDVQRYLDRRASCDHWRGEEAYDRDREREILVGVCKNCGGSDAALDFLKKQHADDLVVMEYLSALDPSIEGKVKGAHSKMCSEVWTGTGQAVPAPAPAAVNKVKGKQTGKASGKFATAKAKAPGSIKFSAKPSGKTKEVASTKSSKTAAKPASKPAVKSSAKAISKHTKAK